MRGVSEKINIYDKLLAALIFSLVFGEIGGALMIARVLAIILIPFLFKRGRYCLDYTKNYIVFFSIFYLFCIISLLWTPDKDQAFKELFYYPIHFILFLEVLVFSRFATSALRTISWSWLFSAGVTLVIAIWELASGNHLSQSFFEADDIVLNVGGASFERPFASVTFGNFNGYVTYLCFAIPFIFYYILENLHKGIRIIISVIILFTTIVVMLIDASRGGLISILVMGAVFLLMTKRSKYKSLFVIVLILFVFFFVVPQSETLFFAMSVKSEGGNLIADNDRLSIWKYSLLVLRDYCYFGSGIGSAAAALKAINSSITNITHNMLLEILMQYGVLFFMVFLMFLINLFIKGWRSKNKSIKICLVMSIVAFPIYSIIDSIYLLSPVVFIAFACMTVYAYNGIICKPMTELKTR